MGTPMAQPDNDEFKLLVRRHGLLKAGIWSVQVHSIACVEMPEDDFQMEITADNFADIKDYQFLGCPYELVDQMVQFLLQGAEPPLPNWVKTVYIFTNNPVNLKGKKPDLVRVSIDEEGVHSYLARTFTFTGREAWIYIQYVHPHPSHERCCD